MKWDSVKNDEVIDLLTWPPTDFFSINNFKLKRYLIFQNRLPRYCRWRNTDVLINSNLFCLEIIIKLSFL